MCISDWRIGRLMRAVPSTRIVPTMDSITIHASPQRVGIDFIFATDAATGFSGFTITQGGVELAAEAIIPYRPSFRVTTHGDLPTKEFVIGNANGSNSSVTIIEYFLPESVITEAIETYQRKYP